MIALAMRSDVDRRETSGRQSPCRHGICRCGPSTWWCGPPTFAY